MEQQVQARSKWKTTVSVDQLVAIMVVVVGAGLMFWKTTDVRINALEIRMQAKEQSDNNISNKLDKLQDGINDVRLTLKDKQDRKN